MGVDEPFWATDKPVFGKLTKLGYLLVVRYFALSTLKFLECSNSSKSVGILNAWLGKEGKRILRISGRGLVAISRDLFTDTCSLIPAASAQV